MAEIQDMFEHVDNFCTSTVRDKCDSIDDTIMLASQLAYQAQRIYEQAGGSMMAAKQFYAIADKLATASPPART